MAALRTPYIYQVRKLEYTEVSLEGLTETYLKAFPSC